MAFESIDWGKAEKAVNEQMASIVKKVKEPEVLTDKKTKAAAKEPSPEKISGKAATGKNNKNRASGRFNISMPVSMHRELKMMAIKENTTVSELVKNWFLEHKNS